LFTLAPYTSFHQPCLPSSSVPEVNNFDFETERLVTVSINRHGKVCIGGSRSIVTNISKLPQIIEDEIETTKSNEWDKVLLEADENVQYGKVVELLNLFTKADIRTVGLITKGRVTTADYIGNRVTIK
jgi:biopolymer transport protein ExbD